MKRALIAAAVLLASCVQPTETTKTDVVDFTFIGNPLVRHVFTADPTARVFNDKLYVYTSHDRSLANYFTMTDWHVFSTDDMVAWRDHGAFFGLDDIAWAKDMAWAPDCVERNGKYYFYYPVERMKIGVAVSDNPVSGFVDSGKPLVELLEDKSNIDIVGREPIDPTVYIHEGQAYMFFGCRDFRYIKLKENMTEVDGEIVKLEIIGNEGDEQNFGGYYGEGPFLFRRGDIFYMVYSNGWGKQSTMVYATASHPEGPYTYQGPVIPNVGCGTSHGSIVEYRGEWYLFYHTMDLSGQGFRRSICFDLISFDKSGKIVPAKQTRSALSMGKDFYDGKGRIALSSDGNKHDNDDMQATMMTLMILAKAGLQDITTLYTYADHIWGSEDNDLELMRRSAVECGEKFGFDKTKFMAAVEDPEAAYEAMKEEILSSDINDPLYIIAAGPMQVVGEAIDRVFKVDRNRLNYVTVISHSEWNNKHSDRYEQGSTAHAGREEEPHSGWTWDEMVKAYGDRVNFNLITDQNGTGANPYKTRNKFSAPSWVSWKWMSTHENEAVRWVYETARTNPCGPDFSDAGMAYYLVADLNGERGDENGNPAKLQQWIGKKF
ncbi:MAG: family 43 glycosylhydrolase [Rikenellaceae bacterium]